MRQHESGRRLRLLTLCSAARRGRVALGPRSWPVSIGRSGVAVAKREGDGATPAGCWTLRAVVYRADRVPRPRTGLLVRPLRPDDGWCDAVGDRNYNRRVRHPYPASAEQLWRDDCLYDIVVVTGHNACPRVQGLGSAIFLHLERPDRGPTAGCLALSPAHMRQLLACLGRRARICVPA